MDNSVNTEMLIREFIAKYKAKDKISERIAIFEAVRDFLYQINGANTPEKLLQIKEGYCASKHRLLQAVYEELGYKTKLCFTPFSFDMLYLPDFLQNWGYSNKKGYHVFLKINISGKRINMDATFNSTLKNFYVVNQDRDGFSSQKIICNYNRVYIPSTPDEEREIKKRLSDHNNMTEEDNKWIEKFNNRIRGMNK